MNKAIQLTLALSVSTVLGCATAPTQQTTQALTAADIDIAAWEATEQEWGEGVVLISTRISKACNTYATDFILKRLSMSTKTYEIQDAIFLNQKTANSQFDDYYGHVYQMTLETGKYQLSLDSTSPLFSLDNEMLSSNFDLKPGEVKYLGEVTLENCSQAGYVMMDNWSNMQSTFEQVFPKLDTQSVTVDMLQVRVPVASL